jgi:hypothetical protein
MYLCRRDFFILWASPAGGSRLIALAPIVMALMRTVAVACSIAIVVGLVQRQNVLTSVFILLALASSYEAWLVHAGGVRWSTLR